MEIPALDPAYFAVERACDLLGKIPNCLIEQKKQPASANRIHKINSR
jgi:hypothetical protein